MDDGRCGKRSCKICDPIRASARLLHDRRLEAARNGDKEVVAGEEYANPFALEHVPAQVPEDRKTVAHVYLNSLYIGHPSASAICRPVGYNKADETLFSALIERQRMQEATDGPVSLLLLTAHDSRPANNFKKFSRRMCTR